jgi:formyltetrahydrofolate dehydrogenase
MTVKILGSENTPAYQLAKDVVTRRGHTTSNNNVSLAIAPLLTKKLTAEELSKPTLGTLIFHPSPLPYGRGASAIRWAYRRKEPVTAATWFWANEGLDTGDICEQEIVKIDYKKAPRAFYDSDILPAMVRTLERCLNNLEIGIKRSVKQVEKYATYDAPINKSV